MSKLLDALVTEIRTLPSKRHSTNTVNVRLPIERQARLVITGDDGEIDIDLSALGRILSSSGHPSSVPHIEA